MGRPIVKGTLTEKHLTLLGLHVSVISVCTVVACSTYGLVSMPEFVCLIFV